MIAIGITLGLAIGVPLGALMWSVSLWLADKKADASRRKQVAEMRQALMTNHKRVEEAKQKIRMQYGDQMTPEQERIMEAELSKLYKDFPNPQVPDRGTA